MKRAILFLAACFLLNSPALAQVGALPYHYKMTARAGTGGAGNDYVLTFEIHDAAHVVKGADTCKYSSAARLQDVRDCVAEKVKLRAATDAGGTAALITAMIGVDNDMEAPPAIAPTTTALGSVMAKTCLSTDKLNAIGTDGIPVCGTDQTSGGSVTTVLALTADATANSTTTGVEITGMNLTVGAGTYVFQYFVRYQAAALTTGVKFGVNHTGTAAVFMANMRYQESTTAASTGAASQASGTGGKLVAGSSARAKSTTAPNLGPTISVDAANADMLVVIEGIIIVTASGDLELWHASEVAAASTVKAGTSLLLTKTAN